MQRKKILFFATPLCIGLFFWLLPTPAGLDLKAWRLFAIFSATIAGVILKPFPMGTVAIFSLTACVATHTLSFSEAFSGFSNEVVWLVLCAFFIARGFIASGLGDRIAYWIMSLIGKNSLGLGYGLVAADLCIAPLIPSLTARAGGIIFPLLKSLADVFTGSSHDPRMGAFLTLAAFQGTAITSAMFLTSMAGNPLIAEFVRPHGIEISWLGWALAALVPGCVSLFVVPLAIFYLVSPVIRKTPHARQMAEEKLAAMGSMKKEEWITLCTFVLLIVLWVGGSFWGIKATAAAMIGLVILLVAGVLRWQDILEEQSAWDTFIWFSILITLPAFLNQFGFMSWMSEGIAGSIFGFHWIAGLAILALLYFYSHYLFASNVGHITAMYVPFLMVAKALGAPAYLAALLFGFLSSLFGGLTHYASGPAPILFGTGFVSIRQWWRIGAIAGFLNLCIWMIVGSLWWKFLGLW